MNDSLSSSLVRIWTTDNDEGIIVGTGFLVGKNRVLTCAHVVTHALGVPENTGEPPQDVVWLDFPLLPFHKRFPAIVALWKPLLPNGGGDIAGLELSGDSPTGANIARFVPARDVWQHPFGAFGFPRGQDNGVWATGQLMGRQAMGWIMVEGVKAQGYSIEQGFSGAPVWDMQAQGVIGMVVAVSQPAELRAAFVIPTDAIFEAWPIIAVQEEPRNPYKGLRSFDKNDSGDFFGREELINELVNATQHLLTSTSYTRHSKSLLAILGPSGSGKSSVMRAGVLPRLQQGALRDSDAWIYLEPVIPGKHPVESLALTLATHLPDRSLKTIREDLEDATARGLYLLTKLLLDYEGTKVILFIDQFEEIFTQVEIEAERQHFINVLLTAISEPQSPLIAFLAMRADFYDRPMQYPLLAQLIQKQQHLVLSMNMPDLRSVIEGPAALPDVQLSFDSGLVDDLLFEMRGQPGALPLLQFTLDQLFQNRRGHQLTQQAYQDIGGVRGALTKHAEEIYAALPSEEHRRLARGLFVRLIDPGATEQDTTRHRATLGEFVLADPTQTRLLQEIIQIFIAARLLVTTEIAGTVTIEVSHEALIRAWNRLSTWIQEAREDIPLQQAISQDAATWNRLDKSSDRLYRGSQLKEAKAWAKRNTPSKQEALFLHTSTTHLRQQTVSMICIILLSIIIAGSAFQAIAFLQPSWCPSYLCPRPRPILQKNSTYDGNLEASLQPVQSSWYMIPGNPKHYTLANLPRSVSVQLIDAGLAQSFRVAIGIHNLRQGRFSMIIEQVAVVVKQVNTLPYPLNAWFDAPKTNYTNNPYRVKYTGEDIGTTISATYVTQLKVAPVQLVSGESDEVTLEVLSHQVADIHFQVSVTYRFANESVLHTLTLLNTLAVMFSDKSNWHPYKLESGHLVANP